MPVPAGMRWPMMMFSFNPSKSSRAPRIAASVNTRVVSWNDAAEMNDPVLRVGEGLLVHVLALQEHRVPGLDDLHLLQHLAHDHADVLVVDLHALEPVYLLHFVQEVLLHRPRALDPQNIVRVDRSLGEAVAGAHPVALVHPQVLAGRHLVQLRLPLFGVDVDLALATLDLAEPHRAVDLGDRGRILGPPGLEQLGHARQAARDVARLVRLARHLREHEPRIHFLAVLDGQLRPLGDDEVAQPLFLLTLLLDDLDVRVQLLLPVLDDHPLAPSGELVQLLAHRLVLDDVYEPHHTAHVRHDRVGGGVTDQQHSVARHLRAVQHHQRGAERYVEARVHGELPGGLAVRERFEDQFPLVARHDLLLLRRLDEDEPVAVLDHALDLGLAHRLLGDTRRRAADVEGPQRQLRARLADRLRRQNPDRLPQVHHVHGGEVAAVAHATHPALRLAGQHRTDADRLDPCVLDRLRGLLIDQLPGLDQHLGPLVLVQLVRIGDPVQRHATHQALAQRLDDVLAFLQRRHLEAEDRAAIFLGDRDVLRHVYQAARQVARVRGLQRRIRETFARAVGRDEVLEHRQPLAEVRLDRALDDLADAAGELLLRFRHQAAHSRQLPDLIARPAAPGVEHHEHRVEAALGALHGLHDGVRDVVVRVRPGVDHLVVALAERDLPGGVGPLEPLHPALGIVQQARLLGRDLQVLHPDRHATHGGVAESELLQVIEELHRAREPGPPVAVEHQLRQVALAHHLVQEPLAPDALGQDAVEHHPPRGGVDPTRLVPEVHRRMVREPLGRDPHVELRQRAHARRLRLDLRLLEVGRLLREEVAAQHHVLRRLGHRPAVRGLEHVVGRDHEHARLGLTLERERHVHGHLIAVEVRVERRAHERMDPDRLAFHQHRLERLDAQAVQRRRAVQEHRVILDDFFQDLVHLRRLLFDDLLGPLDRLGDPLLHQLVNDEGFEQLHRHRLGEPALVQPQLRAHHDHRPARIVHPLAEQVLTEPALLALEHVGQGLQGPLAASADRLGAAAVVEQRVHGLLQHALLVPEDDLRRPVQDQLLQPVVAVDDAAVQVVQIARREAPAVERHQRPQVGRNDRHHVQDHPARVVAAFTRVAGVPERIDDLQALELLLLTVLARLARDCFAQLVRQLVDVEPFEQRPYRRLARLDDDVVRVVDHPLEIPQGHVE